MTITKENAKIINTREVYLHDEYLISLTFDKECKKLILNLKKFKSLPGREHGCYEMHFVNVANFYMTSCDFWGESIRILSFDLVEHDRKLISVVEKNNDTAEDIFKIRCEDLIETAFTFCSGDILRITCEKIELFD